jgi:transcriptional regulator with XRE-family HTH domain
MDVAQSNGDPAHAADTMRHQLRTALRTARTETDLTRREVVDRLEWSESKLTRIESGEVRISPTDLKALLDVYGIFKDTERERFLRMARGSRGRSRWAEFSDLYNPAALALFASEPISQSIAIYEPTFVPGLLQTEAYTRALAIGYGTLDSDEIDILVKSRSERQALLEQEDRPELSIILGEAALSRPVGGAKGMVDQLARIRRLGHQPGNSFQILRFSVGAHPRMGTAFTILRLIEAESIVYLENAGVETIVRNAAGSHQFEKSFSKLQELATDPKELDIALNNIALERFGMRIPD